MNNFSINPAFDFSPRALEHMAREMRRLRLKLSEPILAGPPSNMDHDSRKLIANAIPMRDHLEDAAQAVLRGDDPTEHMVLAAAWSFLPGLAQKITESGKLAYLDVVNANADKIVKALDKQIIQPALKAMRALHEEFPNEIWDLETASSLQKFAQAQRIIDHDGIVRNLEAAYKLRTSLHPNAYDNDAAWAKEPGLIDLIGEPKPGQLAWWMHALSAGFNPWFPTVTEWIALSRTSTFIDYYESSNAVDTAPVFEGFASK